MSSSKLKSFQENINNSNKIKVSELKKDHINKEDIESVEILIKKIRKKLMLNFIFIFLAVIFGSFILFNDIQSVNQMLNLKFIGLLAIPLAFILLLLYIAKQIHITKINKYKKAQYGIVANKYSLKSSSSNTRKRIYYITALFPDTNTTITGVKCSNKNYKLLVEANPVLVISFDNKKAYALPIS